MNYRSEKGFTGVDIAVAIVVLFLFVSLIAMLSYNFTSASQEVEYRSDAIHIAIDEIEKVKNNGFEYYENYNQASGPLEGANNTFVKEGYYKTITVQDYTDLDGNEGKIPNLVKKVTVKISYMFKAKEQNVELSTILAKEK